MTIKEFLISRIQLYFLLVTLIFAVSMIIGMIFTPGQELYYYQLIGPFFLAALCVLVPHPACRGGVDRLSSRVADDVAEKGTAVRNDDRAAQNTAGERKELKKRSGDRFRCALRFWASAAAYFTGTQCSSLIFCTFFTRRTYFSAVSGSVFMNVLTISIAIMPPMIFAPRHSTFASLC